MINATEAMMTPSDVARALQVSKATVLRLARSERLRAIRVGRKTLRFNPSDLAAFMESARA